MDDHSGAEEALFTREGAVDELVDDHELTRRQILAQGPDRRNGDNVGAAGALERIHIGARIDVRRRQSMSASVAGKKDKVHSADPTGQQLV